MKKLLQWKKTIKGEKEKKRNSLSYNENDVYLIDLKHNESNLSKLHQACWTGDEDKVKKHLKRCDINLQDDDNRTPVHLAAARGHKNVLMTLLENNAKVNIQDSQGRTPLMKIVECGHIDLVVMLLEYGVDINIPDYHGDTALHISIDKEQSAITMILLQHKAEVNVRNDDGKTPLHLACCKKQLDVVKILLQRGADVNETDKKLQTPLILACKAESSAIISLLLKNNAKCLLTDFTGQSALDYAYTTGNSEIIDILNQYKTEEASTTDSQGVNEHDVQKEENIEDSWKDVDISTKDLNSITKENIINKTPKHSLKLYNSEKQNEQNPLEKDEILSIFQENEIKNTEDIYSSPQKSIASLGLSQLKPLKRKDDDLFADLSFSDSTSDNDDNLEIIENKQGESKNEKILHPSLYDKVIKTDGNNCNDFVSSDDDLNFEPYVPSVIDRKFSVDENQFKRPPLNRRSVSLDISSPIKHTTVNEATNSNSKENSENLSSKPNTNLLVPDIKKNSSESEWDSEDSYNSNDNKNLKNSKTEDCVDAVTQNTNNTDKELNMLESKKVILSENENYVEPESINPADLKDQTLEKSNSLNSDKDFSSSENSKNVNSGQTDHWSTLGRFGTMQGRDEMWENNAKIVKNSGELGDNLSKNDVSNVKDEDEIDNINENEKVKVALCDDDKISINVDKKEVEIDKVELNKAENKITDLEDESQHSEQNKQEEKLDDLNHFKEEEKSVVFSENSKSFEIESEIDFVTNLEEEILESNLILEQNEMKSSDFQNNKEDFENPSLCDNDLIEMELTKAELDENKTIKELSNKDNIEILEEKLEINILNSDEFKETEKVFSDRDIYDDENFGSEFDLNVIKQDKESDFLISQKDRDRKQPSDIDELNYNEASFLYDIEYDDKTKLELKITDNINENICTGERKLSTDINKSIDSEMIIKLDNEIKNDSSTFVTNGTMAIEKQNGLSDLEEKSNSSNFSIEISNDENQENKTDKEVILNIPDDDIEKCDDNADIGFSTSLNNHNSSEINSHENVSNNVNQFNKVIKMCELNERDDVRMSSFDDEHNSEIDNSHSLLSTNDNSFNKYISHEITNKALPYLSLLETQNQNTSSDDYLEQISKNLIPKLTFRRLSVDQLINGVLDPPQNKCVRRKSFNELSSSKDTFSNHLNKTSKLLLRQNHYEDDDHSEEEVSVKESKQNSQKLGKQERSFSSGNDHSEGLNYITAHRKSEDKSKSNLLSLYQDSKQIQSGRRSSYSNENEEFVRQRNNLHPLLGNLLASSSWESWYSGTNHRQMRRLSMSVINSKPSDFLEQIPEKPEHRRLSLCFHKSTFEGTINHEVHNLDKVEKSNCISNETNKDINRKQFRVALTRSLSLNTVLNDENNKTNDKSIQITHKITNYNSKYKTLNSKASCSTSLSDSVFEENNSSEFIQDNLEKNKSKQTVNKSQKLKRHSDENSTPHIILTSWENEEIELQPEEMNKNPFESSSPPKNKVNQPAEASKKKEYLLPEGGSLDEDSSTTITDTEDDKKKVNEVHLDPNEERDDTLSISTDEDLFLEEVCEKNESVHQHSISPSQLASLQGSLREHRLTVNKKSQKIKSLKNQLKAIQHEKIQIQEKIEKMSSSNSALRNNILEMKNQLTSLQYNLEEEKQVRENGEVLLNTMKERLSHKDDLFVNENNIRKSLENEIRTMKEQFKLIETNNQILQMENTKLKMQLEQEKLLSIDQRKSAKPETAEKSIITEMELEKQEQENHLVKINNELQLENVELKEKIKKLEDDLNNKVAELSGKLEVVQDKKNQIENQLQILDKELQKKQYELNKSIEMHNVHIKGIEFEKEELRKEAKSELDKRLALENKAIETFQEINKLNSECQNYKQMIEALKISSVKESENYEVLEKLRIENQDLKRELNDIKKLYEYTENITTQEKEAAKNTLSCINDELQKTKIQLDDKSVKILELQKSIRERDQSAFEKDLKFNELEKENSYLNQKVDKLQQRFLAQQKELNFLKLESEDNGNNSAELCAKIEILNKQIDSLKLERFQLEEELAKEKDYSNMLNSKIDTFKKNEDKIHQQIHLLKAEKNTLQEKLSKENEHCQSLHQQLKSFNEKEELLNEKVDMLQMQNKQLEDELSKEKEHSNMLDNKLETFNQNLKKMEMLVESLQTAKEELESKINVDGSFNNNLSRKEIICTNHSSPDDNSVFQLTEKLKVMEHAKEKTEMLLQKEREKSYKVMKLKQSSDILLEQENFRIHQLMDIISKLKTELAMSNNKIKSLDNFTHDLEQRYQREEWRTKIDDLNKQIEQLQKEMGIERNLRYEAESKCSLLETELHSLRTIQTTLIEELLNELKSAKSQNKDQRMETSPIESGYKQLENRNHEEIYHVLRDISLQLRKNQQQKPELPEKNDFIKTKNKLMKELSQLQSSIISKGQEYDILEQERDLLQRKYEFDNSKNPVQDIETPVKLSSENERPNVSFLNYVPDRRWSSISSLNNMPIDRRNSSDIHLQSKDPPPLRNSFSVIHTPTNLQLLKEKEHDNSNKVLPEFQIKLDNAITRHLNSGPRIDISIPPRHKKDDESAKDYLSALKKKYFV